MAGSLWLRVPDGCAHCAMDIVSSAHRFVVVDTNYGLYPLHYADVSMVGRLMLSCRCVN